VHGSPAKLLFQELKPVSPPKILTPPTFIEFDDIPEKKSP
jgi:hypothetical protein